MANAKVIPLKKKKPSGRNVEEVERGTERLTLRLDPETMNRLRSFAFEHGWTLAQTLKEAFNALDRELDEEQKQVWED